MRPLNFSITRSLAAYGLGFFGTLVVIGLVLALFFGPQWARVVALILLVLDFTA